MQGYTDGDEIEIITAKKLLLRSEGGTELPYIACLLMEKNEKESVIYDTMESARKYVDAYCVYDTGSTNGIQDYIQEYCKKNKKTLYLQNGQFVDFSTSRNVLHAFADEKTGDGWFYLLLDCNDELRNGEKLLEFIKDNQHDTEHNGWLMQQEWHSPVVHSYWNCRLIRSRKGFLYHKRIHEYIQKEGESINTKVEGPILYQDRCKEGGAQGTGQRWLRDKELLLQDYKDEAGGDGRTVFYLAQTLNCLGENANALKYYTIRSNMVNSFQEERYEAMVKCGDISNTLGKDWIEESMKWYWKAFGITPRRAEPLIKIANHYINKDWYLAYMAAKAACILDYPKDCILFVEPLVYSYHRWFALSHACYYANEFEEGKEACLKILEKNPTDYITININLPAYDHHPAYIKNFSTPTSIPFPEETASITTLQKMLAKNKNDNALQLRMARAYEEEGNKTNNTKVLEKALTYYKIKSYTKLFEKLSNSKDENISIFEQEFKTNLEKENKASALVIKEIEDKHYDQAKRNEEIARFQGIYDGKCKELENIKNRKIAAECDKFTAECNNRHSELCEEAYANYKCGEVSEKLAKDWSDICVWYIYSFSIMHRVEPLIKIGEYTMDKDIYFAYMVLKTACIIETKNPLLEVHASEWEYKRWSMLGKVCYNLHLYAEGIKAYEMAAKSSLSTKEDSIRLAVMKSQL